MDRLHSPKKSLRFEDLIEQDEHKRTVQEVVRFSQYAIKGKKKLALGLVKTFTATSHQLPLLNWRNDEDETILHIVIKTRCDDEVALEILHLCPDLLFIERTYGLFKGQTALHLAITLSKTHLCDVMLTVASQKKAKLRKLLNSRACGEIFENTVMMGQLPLFTAALTFNKYMVEILLRHGASLFCRNNHGDTVFHSIIKYTRLNRDRTPEARQMIELLHQNVVEFSQKQDIENGKRGTNKGNFKHIWYVRNDNFETALQLAARCGIAFVVEDIMNLRGVYRFVNFEDSLIDDMSYDITEIDSITNLELQHDETLLLGSNNKPLTPYPPKVRCGCIRSYRPVQTESILEMMFDKGQAAVDIVDIIEIKPVRSLIKLKWNLYKTYYSVWMVIHYLFMVLYSIYAVEYAYSEHNQTDSGFSLFISIFQWISLLYGFLYLCIGLSAILARLWKPSLRRLWKHNIYQASIILVFAMALIVESIVNIAQIHYSGYIVVIAINSGWWFNIFFLRGWKLFSFFTVLLKRVIVGDLLRFSFIIIFQLFAFTAAIHMQYQGIGTPSVDGEDYDPDNAPRFFASFFLLFNTMIGLGGVSDTSSARVPIIANGVYIIFIILTYILLMNALIAMMSRTCADLKLHRYPLWRIQQLSVIVFLEDILALFLASIDPVTRYEKVETKRVSMFDPTTNSFWYCNRYFLDMRALQETNIGDDIEEERLVYEKREKASVSNKMTKELLSELSVTRSLIPLIASTSRPVEIPNPPPLPPKSPSPVPSSPVSDTDSISLSYPRFFEFNTQRDDEVENDDVDFESKPEAVLKKVGQGTFIDFRKDYL